MTQASNIGHLASALGSLLEKSGTALWNDPIAVMNNGITTTFTLCELIRNTANFTSDLTVGKLYLSPEEYKLRTDAFCAMMKPLQGITAEHCIDFVAQLTADIFFFKGLGNTYRFLKEIDVLGKLGESAAAVARIFKKGFDTHLANHPVVVTAEGITIKISDAMHNINKGGGGKNIINSSRALIDSMTGGLLSQIKNEINTLKQTFEKRAQFKNNWLQLDYEHIFTLDGLYWKKGKPSNLGGLHHDFTGSLQNSGALQIVEKFVNEKSGYYLADIIIDDVCFKGKTFFPKSWTRQEVTTTIYEAYDKFIKSGAEAILEANGKYKIEVLVEEGVKIRMIITENGIIRSAYPILETKGIL